MGMFDVERLVAHYGVVDRTRPHLRANFISSIDGAATHDGVSGPLNNDEDQFVFRVLRMMSDVVVVGEGTVHKEGYGALRLPDDAVAWRVAHGLPENPTCAVISFGVNLDAAAEIFADAPVRPIVVTVARADDAEAEPGREQRLRAISAVADVMVLGETVLDLSLMVTAFAARGLPQILCEGGPRVLGSLIEADVVDELDLTISPVLEGGDSMRITTAGAQTTRTMRLESAMPTESMLFLRYLRTR